VADTVAGIERIHPLQGMALSFAGHQLSQLSLLEWISPLEFFQPVQDSSRNNFVAGYRS
jgi:hypothetical protein